MSDAGTLVTTFIERLCAKDLEGALALVADDVEYDNVPIGKVHGPGGIRTTLAPFVAGFAAIDWVISYQVAQGDVVMNERVDRFQRPDGTWLELPVAGLFTVRDGKVTLWRDYFDLASFQKAMAGG